MPFSPAGFVKSVRLRLTGNRLIDNPSPPEGTIPEVAHWLRLLSSDRLPFSFDPDLLASWLHELRRIRPNRPATRRVLLVSAMTHWNRLCLPVAMALAARVRVDLAFAPYRSMTEFDPGTTTDEALPAGDAVKPVTLHPNLRILNLRGISPSSVSTDCEAVARKFADKDHRYATYREELPSKLTADDERIRDFRFQRNRDLIARLETLLKREHYDSALIPNGAIYEFGVAYERCRAAGLPVVTFDNHEQQFRMNLADRVPCPLTDTEGLWEADTPHLLSAERRERVTKRLLGREKPGWTGAGYIWDGQPTEVAEWPELATRLGLDPRKPTALMCTNLAWDTAVLGRARTFGSMREWLAETVKWFANRPDWQLVVRAHPCEATMPTNEPAVGLMDTHFPKRPSNVAVVAPADRVNTYGLMRACQMGLVYSTTVGFEMAARGLPTVVAADVHYGEKGFTLHAPNAVEYAKLLHRIAANPVAARLTPRKVELALCYADMYFEQFPKPFPWWRVDAMDQFGTETPMADVLQGTCDPRYQLTLDMLAGLQPVG